MANNIFEQFDEAYSCWSILDKIGKEMQLARLWQQMRAIYDYLYSVCQKRGYLTPEEAKYANQICQFLQTIQDQKIQTDNALVNEMLKHLVKMKTRHQ